MAKSRIFLFVLFSFSISVIFSQTGVTVNSSANQLAQTIAGFGVTVSNAQLNCSSSGAGTFTYSGVNLGLTSGVILCTGDATTAVQPQGTSSSAFPGNSVNDPQLTGITSNATNDVCILQFDFVPICPNLSIKYVFGSEEYPNFVGAGYNDAFGIFLTGPNPSGGSYSSQNIALLPNGQAVSIDNVNSSSNSTSFVANYNNGYNDVVYDGFTTPITSTANIVPCQTYHIKFAIADAGDEALDSGVFIQYDGLSCTSTPTITPSSTASSCTGSTGTASMSVNGGTVTSYQWLPGGQTTPGITGQAPGTYTCILTFSSSCTTFTQSQTVVIQSTAVTPTVSISSNTPCIGGTLTFTTNSNGNGYTWTGPNGFNSNNQSPSISGVTSSAAGIYTVVITNSLGCSTTTMVTASINTSSSPTATSSGTICSGQTISLLVSSGGAGSTYTWSGPNGFASASQNPTIPNATTNNTGVYSVTVTSSAGCAGSTTVSATVNALPTPTASSNAPICAGTSLNLSANGGNTYSWSGPAGFSSNQQNPTISPATTNQAGVYTVTVDVNGCTATASVNVAINTSISVSLSPIPTICLGNTASLTSPAGGTSYSWTGPNGFSDTQQNPSIPNYSAANDGVYSVSITTSGCVSTGTVLLQSYSQVSYAVVPSDKVFCDGKSASLSAAGQGGSGLYNYNWSPATGLSSTSTPSTTANPSSSQSYTVTLSDGNCPLAPVAITVVNVTVNPTPIITFSVSNPSGCQPFCTEISSSSNPPSATCSWKLNNGSLTMTSAACSPSLCFVNHGIYDATLSVTDINGCSNSLSQQAFITVFPKPIADFSWIPMPPTIIDNKVHFVDQSVLGTPMTNWSWNFGDFFCPLGQDTSNLQNPYHTYENVGDYDVTLIVQNQYGCIDTVTRKVTVEDDFALYIPNAFSPWVPDGVNDEFMVQGSGFLSDSFEMYIYDRWGQLLYKSTDIHKGWDGTFKGQKVKEDVYVYKIKVKDFKGKKHEFVGHITVL